MRNGLDIEPNWKVVQGMEVVLSWSYSMGWHSSLHSTARSVWTCSRCRTPKSFHMYAHSYFTRSS